MKIDIPFKILTELLDELPGLMNQYHYNSNGCDFSCAFCGTYQEEKLANGTFSPSSGKHTADCLGAQLQIALRPFLDEDEKVQTVIES